jgi:adenylate cyclase
MATGTSPQEPFPVGLEEELHLLRSLQRMNGELDETLERAFQQHWALARTLDQVMPVLCAYSGAVAVHLRTFDENLELHDFQHLADTVRTHELDFAAIFPTLQERQPFLSVSESGSILGQHFDAAGQFLGGVAISFVEQLDEGSQERCKRILLDWCEELDNYLAAIAHARYKHQVTVRLSAALREPVLERGIYRAIEVLHECLEFEDLILIYHHQEDAVGPSLDFKIIKDGKLVCDSSSRQDEAIDTFMRQNAREILLGQTQAMLERFNIHRYREEALISGVKLEQVIGRLIVASQKVEFNTFDRDLLDLFSDYLCQRIVDFNREWRDLSHSFAPEIVLRMLNHEDYQTRFLQPQEHEVAVLFCDITGFTRISEQHLHQPALIGQLINTWSAKVVETIWQHGGVFDKMVGDCIIGLWGPPFFETSPQETCNRAAQAAWQIRDYTRALPTREALHHLRDVDPPLGVAIGLNYCPLFVGQFGPDDNFTGFSSGMNNTARLQGIAERDEILGMDSFVRIMGYSGLWGMRRTTKVKNVAQPLAYYPLIASPEDQTGDRTS